MRKNSVNAKALEDAAWRIGTALHAEKVILFGSHAWGKPGPDSDVDLFVVMNSKKRPADRAIDAYNAVFPNYFPVDIMVRTPQEIRRRLAMGDFFIEDIVTKGKTLYERKPS